MTKSAVFFLSTGRCGTQWFADSLARAYPDLAVVRHEPLSAEYRARYHFDAYHANEDVEFSPAIESHVAFVADVLRSSHYIETGWPAYGVLPFLRRRFNDQMKIVHLYRDPLRTAASLLGHNVYKRGTWTDAVAISPANRGVVQTELRGELWSRASEFEKCLFWWTEINNYALELQQAFSRGSWLSLKFENVFAPDGKRELAKLLRFLDLPERADFFDTAASTKDVYRAKTDEPIEIATIAKYPKCLQVMSRLGYSLADPESSASMNRYRKPYFALLPGRRSFVRAAHKLKAYTVTIVRAARRGLHGS